MSKADFDEGYDRGYTSAMSRAKFEYERGYAAGHTAGQQGLLEYLAKKESLSVRPIYVCLTCGKVMEMVVREGKKNG